MSADDEGLDRFCYDAIAPWSHTHELALVALTRSAELVWIVFDANPAVAANVVIAVQTIERFLAEGPPTGAPARCAEAARAHLLALRTPGTTTRVELAVRLEGPSAHAITGASLFERGASRVVPVPGPRYAGLYEWPACDGRAPTLRTLVTPGRSTAELELDVMAPTYARRTASFDVDVPRGGCVRLAHVVRTD